MGIGVINASGDCGVEVEAPVGEGVDGSGGDFDGCFHLDVFSGAVVRRGEQISLEVVEGGVAVSDCHVGSICF